MRQNPHVRICGGLGSATTLVYPTADRRAGWHQAAVAHAHPQTSATFGLAAEDRVLAEHLPDTYLAGC